MTGSAENLHHSHSNVLILTGLSDLESCKLQMDDLAFKESRIREELVRLASSDDEL